MALKIRSAVFSVVFIIYTGVRSVSFIPYVFCPKEVLRGAMARWAREVQGLMKSIVGITVSVEGKSNLPSGSCVIASRHMSAFDTLFWLRAVSMPAYVLKKELLLVPLYGQYAWVVGMIFHDRKGGASSVRKMISDIKDRVAKGMQVIIFPQGTRVKPGARGETRGVGALFGLYVAGTTVIPVSTNSGVYWGRRSFFGKRPGVIRVVIHPPVRPGMSRPEFIEYVGNIIGEESNI